MADTTPNDSNTTVQDLRCQLQRFVDARDWHQFHSPKNLSMSLAIEAAELMEHFQWIDVAESRQIREDPKKLHEVGEELADVLCYALAMANELGLDVSSTLERKMAKNEQKYPVDEYKGRY